jgi:hypothetical protein
VYLTYMIKSQARIYAQWQPPTLSQAWPRTERKSCLAYISSGWLDIIAMSELPEDKLAGVGVDTPPQGPFPPGDVRRHPEAPGHSYLGQAAAEPTSGQHEVPSEDPLFNEIEIDDGEAPQLHKTSRVEWLPSRANGDDWRRGECSPSTISYRLTHTTFRVSSVPWKRSSSQSTPPGNK